MCFQKKSLIALFLNIVFYAVVAFLNVDQNWIKNIIFIVILCKFINLLKYTKFCIKLITLIKSIKYSLVIKFQIGKMFYNFRFNNKK